ncbi:MAG: Fur family transcriptional regulator [Bacteroidota bacterium]
MMDVEAAHEILTKYLKEHGKLRSTPERFAVLDAVLQSQGHFDAEGLYYRMITKGIKVSKATVYNTLDLLQNCGLVSKYRFAENTSRYEKAFGRPHHHHLICLECGDIIEFVNDRLEKIQDEVCGDKNFTPQSSTLQIFGTCSKCRKKA